MKPLQTDHEYRRAMARLGQIHGSTKLGASEGDEYESLAALITDWERRNAVKAQPRQMDFDPIKKVAMEPMAFEPLTPAIPQDRPTVLTPTSPWRITALAVLDGYRLWARFLDGTEGVVDLSALVQSPNAGVFAGLRNPAIFARAFLEMGVVTWPGGLDIAPDAMHTEILRTGHQPRHVDFDLIEKVALEPTEFAPMTPEIKLTPEDLAFFAEGLLNPPPLSPAMARAFERLKAFETGQRQDDQEAP